MLESIDVSKSVEKICLIDGDSLLYYDMDKPTLEEAKESIDSRVRTILTECSTTKYVGFLTGAGCFRYSVSPTYKSNRKGKPKPVIFYALREYLKQKYGFYEYSKLEADDLVSYYHQSDLDGTIICSPDKDVLKQCEGTHFNYQKVEFVTTTAFEATRFLWKQVLMGDSTDGVVGIPGVGEKTAENWLVDRERDFEAFALKKYVEKFGSIEGIMQFNINFRLVYLLKNDDDILREIGEPFLPKLFFQTLDIYNDNNNSLTTSNNEPDPFADGW
jgi:5'-3' exonuclease